MARLMALGRTNFVFNQAPMRQREALVLIDADTKKPVIYADNAIIEREAPAMSDAAALKRTSFGVSMVSGGVQASAIDLYNNRQEAVQDDYSYYKLFQTPRDNVPTSIRDTEEIDSSNLRFFTVLSNEGQISSYDFPNGVWFRASQALPGAKRLITTAPDGKQGLFAVTDKGAIYPFDLSARRFGAALNVQMPADVKAIAKVGANVALLKDDGIAYRVTTSGSSAIPGLENKHFSQMVNAPLYDAFDVAQ